LIRAAPHYAFAASILFMNSWVRWSGGKLIYDGPTTRSPFTAWADTVSGRDAIAREAEGIRFALLGRSGAARRRLWRRVKRTARHPRIVAEVQREANVYLRRLGTLVFCDGLPRLSVELHRLVVVPAVLLNTAAYTSLAQRLDAQPAFRELDDDGALREFFVLALIDQLGAAVAAAGPSPARPLPAGREWTSVGINRSFVWRVPFEAPDWFGHQYVFELTRERVTRATRKLLEEKMRGLESSLESLSKAERADILRRAVAAA
jgi:hypothetical protein